MNETKMNWAGPEQYEKVRVILEAKEMDQKNVYLYQKILKQSGYDTFMGDINPWIKAIGTDVSEIKIDLGE